MSMIFVNTDNTDPQDKLFSGTRAGSSASKAEDKILKTVCRVLHKSPGFTTARTADAKGYSIRLSVQRVEIVGPDTKCSMSGSIVRYPKSTTMNQGDGEVMVTTGMNGTAKATGKDERAILDCVEAICEDLLKKSIDTMRMDFTKR